MKIKEIIKRSCKYLSSICENPRLEAEMLVSHSLGKDRLWLYLNMDLDLEDSILVRLRDLLKRRRNGEPIHFILGYKEFMSLKFKVERGVFIPRFETEELVEKVVTISRKYGYRRFADLGTGVGTIAISIAKFVYDAVVYGVDISKKAIELARENAKLNAVENVFFYQEDMIDFLKRMADDFEVIVSNPPYLSEYEWMNMRHDDKEYEPKEAFVAGNDGMSFYNSIIENVVRVKGKKVFLEISPPRKPNLIKLMNEYGLNYKIFSDLSKRSRILFFET